MENSTLKTQKTDENTAWGSDCWKVTVFTRRFKVKTVKKTDNKVYNAYILMKNYVLQTDKSDR